MGAEEVAVKDAIHVRQQVPGDTAEVGYILKRRVREE